MLKIDKNLPFLNIKDLGKPFNRNTIKRAYYFLN